MNDASQDLVTSAEVPTATEANLVKNELGSVGIKAYLFGEEAVSMAWHLTGALGGIKVQVATCDAEDAFAFLESAKSATRLEHPTSVADLETLRRIHEEEDEVLTNREITANRALRAAFLGLICLPIQVYALVLLFRVFASKEKLAGRARTNAKIAAWITGSLTVACGFMVAIMILGPVQSGVNLRDLNHPYTLVGTWDGTFPGRREPIKFTMELKRDGRVHYQAEGAETVDCTGTWGYQNWTLYVCYDRFIQGDSPRKGQIFAIPVEDFQESEIHLVTERGKALAVRRP